MILARISFRKGRVAELCSIGQGHPLNVLLEEFLHTGTIMAIPCYVNEIISDVRGIKPGWYAMDEVGNLSTGPFLSQAECLESITQPTYEG